MSDERGVAAAVVLFPMFAAAVFMFVNAAMWQLDRQVATAAADRAAQAVALYGSSVGAASSVAVEQTAEQSLQVHLHHDVLGHRLLLPGWSTHPPKLRLVSIG